MANLDDLKELAKGIDRNKVKNIKVIGNNDSSNTKINAFYQALLDDKFQTDEEYADYFYQDFQNNKAYYKLKDRLQEQLINTSFFIDINQKKLSEVQKSYYICHKNLNAINILLGKDIRNIAISLTKKTIKKSLTFGFTSINIRLSRILRRHYCTFEVNNKKYKYYTQILNRNLKILQKEIKVEDYTNVIYLHHYKRKILDEKKYKLFKYQFKYIKKIITTHSSYKVSSYGFLYIFLYLELSCSWSKLINECNNFFDYIKTYPNLNSPYFLGVVISRKIIGHFMLKQYELAHEAIQDSIKYFPEGTYNWFLVQVFNVQLKFHTKRFDGVENILSKINKCKNNSLYQNWIEHFKLFEAFFFYLKITGKVTDRNAKNKKDINTFRLQKFLNEVPNHSKDKKGSNITILILQVLFLLEDQKYDTLIDRAESLKVYTQRYLKGEGTYRSNCFIKMLLCLSAGNFERIAVERKAKKHVDQLLAMPIEKAKQSAELEVMPYEMLWEFVLESLDRQKK